MIKYLNIYLILLNINIHIVQNINIKHVFGRKR